MLRLGRCPSGSISVAIVLCFVLQASGYLKSSFKPLPEATDPPWVRFLVSLVGALLLGRLSDAFGRRSILLVIYLGCFCSTLAAMYFPSTAWPMRSFFFFEQYFGILKAVVGDRCKDLNATLVETSLYFSLLNVACLLAINVSALGALLASSWGGILEKTLWLQLASAPLLCLMKESGPRFASDQYSFSAFVVMKSVKRTGCVWALGWISLIALGAFLFPPALAALTPPIGKSATLISVLAGIVGTLITAPAVTSQGAVCVLTGLASFQLIARSVEVAGAVTHHDSVVELFGVLSAAASCMGNALNATLLTHFSAAPDLGGLFGIGDAIANAWGIATPALAAGFLGLGCSAWTFVGVSISVTAMLIPYAACAAPPALARSHPVAEDGSGNGDALL